MQVGDKLYTISGTGVIRYFCPAEVVRLTPKQVVVQSPSGQRERYWLHNRNEVGGCSKYLRDRQPEEGPAMRLSAMAK